MPHAVVDGSTLGPGTRARVRGGGAPIGSDLAICDACARELVDPANRRYRDPFIGCASCGPRFTIATGSTADRAATTLGERAMCPACRREHDDPGDRRFQAPAMSCPACGPKLALWRQDGAELDVGDPLMAAAARLRAGAIVAVKGTGGFHLACDATRGEIVAALRLRRRRDERPFAVLVADLAAARAIASVGEAEAALLGAPERPVVLVRRRPDAALAREVAPEGDVIGLILPTSGLERLLVAEVGLPLVWIAASLDDEPICDDELEAVTHLRGLADALLVHDRAIATRCDDSVAQVIADQPTLVRRSRGWVPRPLVLARPVAHPVLGCGALLRNTCCLVRDDRAYFGPHVGDLAHLASLDFYEQAIARLQQLVRAEPAVLAHDLHPGYLSTLWAELHAGMPRIAVQHHHAHVASAMAEHHLLGPVIGVAYDGGGWGPDETAWGGELLLTHLDRYERLATFRPIRLAGGDAALRAPWRIALALVEDAYDGAPPLDALPLFAAVPAGELALVRRMLATGLDLTRARGVGRFFDGIAALVLARARTRHDGQLALAWSMLADPGEHPPYPWTVDRAAAVPSIDLRPLVRAVVDDLRAGVAAPVIAARFHQTLIAATAGEVGRALTAHGPLPVVLTGGCFQNGRLAAGVAAALAGADVRRHGEVPPGDGGVALGQALVADAIIRRRR